LEWKIGHHFQKASKSRKSSIIILSTTIPAKVAYLALRTCTPTMQATSTPMSQIQIVIKN
jgi:hypothetical protein